MAWMYVGIDVSKDTLDVVVRQAGKNGAHKVFANERVGIGQLVKWLNSHPPSTTWACMEATGQYGDEVAERLHSLGYPVSVVNPLCTKSYARSGLVRNQTDKVDAGLLAEFCEKREPRLWTPPSALQKTLRALSRRLDDLQGMQQSERNRLQASKNLEPLISESLALHLTFLTERIEILKKELFALLLKDPELKRQKQLLMSIKGIGELTAVRFLSELGDLREFADARQLAAFLGLTPEFKTSGSSVRTKAKMSKKGNAAVRKMLYMPAISAKNTNPIVHAFCERLALSRKCNMALIGAAMHKLVHLMFGVVHSGKLFDPDYLKSSQVAS